MGVHEWRKRTATGVVVSAVAMGLRDALENTEKDQPPVIVDADGDLSDDERMRVNLFPGHPELSWVVIRPDN
jgi:hypothetical protein